MTAVSFDVRRATPDDAAAISALMHVVVGERIHSAIDRAWTVDEERRYLVALGLRESVHVAVAGAGEVVGCQDVGPYSRDIPSMAHAAQLGTFVLPAWRGRGVGQALFSATERFARAAGFRKIVIHVRASNRAAQAFYARLGFIECGRLRAHVVLDGVEDDEVLMEMMLGRT